MPQKMLSLSLLLCVQLSVVSCMYEELKKPTYLEGRVGGNVLFNCKISDFVI